MYFVRLIELEVQEEKLSVFDLEVLFFFFLSQI
jgi:hypothetical protein